MAISMTVLTFVVRRKTVGSV